jgi:hypothetical protein
MNRAVPCCTRATSEEQRLAIARRTTETKEHQAIFATTINASARDTPTNNPRFDIHRGARVRHTTQSKTKKSAVLCTQATAPLRGSATLRNLAAPSSLGGLKGNTRTHKRHATPMRAYATPPRSDFLRTACTPTSIYSNGFCVIGIPMGGYKFV